MVLSQKHQIFQKIPKLQIIICLQCKHAVHPREIPRVLDYPLPVIPIYNNRLLCQKSHGTTPCMTQHWYYSGIPAVEQREQQVQLQQSFRMNSHLAVQARELQDANPWLRMTRWACTPDPELEDAVGRATRVVWDTMEQLARRSQHTVQHCGNGIRMAAVSTVPNQIPHQPLRAYMDETSIQDHVWPWQQILLFIIRTQTDWPWKKKPGYRLWQLAMQAGQGPGLQDAQSAQDPRTCLEFCIELLNQKIKVHEYKSLLAWLGPESYPPIISRVFKAAAAEQGSWTGDTADSDLGLIMEDKGFAEGLDIILSPPSSLESSHAMPIGRTPRTQRMPFQAGVDWMVQKFMVRGQHGPVEVLLDWRTFSLKIYYNTTAPGHVTWIGQEQQLYKNMNFTMGEFRGFVHGLV
ncbi:uncharacterized protein BDV17DRAFT_285675 [Aspergillus undulatus]|uniref:uncharacterized protein n=1 Tax=Aspergillus undulatus TaxID=1810928 RepID=UPI003CCD9449